jgi:PPOX class probable F420-dependent enzyme
MDLHDALDFMLQRHQGVLVTRRRDGRPQLSNIVYALGDGTGGTGVTGVSSRGDGPVRISTTASRAKTRNLRRDPAASLYVPGDTFWSYVVIDGTAELSPVAAAPDDAVVDELVELYRAASGQEHPDWEEFRTAMVAEGRLVVRLRPTHAYGQS